jgi:hypothetical protein
LFALVVSEACAPKPAQPSAAAVAPDQKSASDTSDQKAVAEPPAKIDFASLKVDEMTSEQALAVVESIKQTWPSSKDNPLLTPKSKEEVLTILKLDQITLFEAGVAYISKQDDAEAMALHGQIELAWGEAYLLVDEVLKNLRNKLNGLKVYLESKENSEQFSAAQKKQLCELRANLHELDVKSKAFQMVAAEHIERGSAKAVEMLTKYADNYLGYRLAADYYRLKGMWKEFDDMLKKLQQHNPESNGWVFLQGVEALQKRKDVASATAFFKKAINNDGQFARAQAHLMRAHKEISDIYAELLNLEKINPEHQLVLWAGPNIKMAYEKLKDQSSVGKTN